MDYKLIITEHAEELLDRIVSYILYQLKNNQAAIHLLDEIEKIYVRLTENPYQFAKCQDNYLKMKNYYEAVVPDMRYLVIYRIDDDKVYILGIFHELENYSKKFLYLQEEQANYDINNHHS